MGSKRVPQVDSQMSAQQPRWLIALMAPPEVDRWASQMIQELSDRYHTRTARVSPHVTLQAPFHWPREQIPALEQALAQFTSEYAPIPIQLSGFGSFGKKVLYIHVEKSQELMTLQSGLAQHLAEQFQIVDPKAQFRSFSPHMTVASRKLTPQTFDQAWQYLQKYSVDVRYVSDRLTLLIYDDHQWHLQRDFLLLP